MFAAIELVDTRVWFCFYSQYYFHRKRDFTQKLEGGGGKIIVRIRVKFGARLSPAIGVDKDPTYQLALRIEDVKTSATQNRAKLLSVSDTVVTNQFENLVICQ